MNPDAKRGAARSETPARRWPVHRCSDARPRPGVSKPLAQMPYQTVGDLALTFPAGRLGRELPARSRSRDGNGSRLLHQRRRDVLARGVRERARPGHRHAADGQPSRADLLRGAHADASAGDGRGDGGRGSRDARRQWRRRRHHRGWPSHDGRLEIRGSRPRDPDRGHAPRRAAMRVRRPRRRRGDVAHRGGDQLPDL